MNGYITNIERATLENTDYRRVLYTTHGLQLVLMHLEPGVEIGRETHGLDQFLRIEAGSGKVILGSEEHAIADDDVVLIPAGQNTTSSTPGRRRSSSTHCTDLRSTNGWLVHQGR